VLVIYLEDISSRWIPGVVMSRANRTEYVILGLLSSAPKSGYAIKNEVEEVIGHFWRESFGQIYPALERLQARGFVQRDSEPAGQRRRFVYTITASGREELRAWLAAPPEPDPVRYELLLKLFFGRNAAPDVLARHVSAYRERAVQVDGFLSGVEEEFR